MTDKQVLPVDIRLMIAVANVIFVAAALLVIGLVLVWCARLQAFEIKGLSIEGDASHYNDITLRANVLPRLQGTFFTLNLHTARTAFETLPWVRQAIVRRDFPNRIKVRLQEHQAVAFWGDDGDLRLLNSYGEVFDANVGELEQDNLPRLNGPADQSAQVLAMYQNLQPLFDGMDLTIDQLALAPRGGWHARLDTGTQVELGRGGIPEVAARTVKFLRTMTQVTARYQRTPDQLESVDLRHTDGYTVRMDGVKTLEDDSRKKQ